MLPHSPATRNSMFEVTLRHRLPVLWLDKNITGLEVSSWATRNPSNTAASSPTPGHQSLSISRFHNMFGNITRVDKCANVPFRNCHTTKNTTWDFHHHRVRTCRSGETWRYPMVVAWQVVEFFMTSVTSLMLTQGSWHDQPNPAAKTLQDLQLEPIKVWMITSV